MVAVERDDQRRLWQCGDQDRLAAADADRDADRAGQLTPELARGRMRGAPLVHVCLQLFIGASVIADDATQSADRSAKAAGEIGGLALLPIGRADRLDALVQHARGDDAVDLDALVAGPVELPVGVELPRLAGQPRQHARLDSGEVGADEMLSGSSAQHRARDRAYDLQRIAPARQCIAITGDHGVDQRGGQLAVVAGRFCNCPVPTELQRPGPAP